MSRPRHQNKEIESLIRELELAGWVINRDGGYFIAKCPCGKHMKTIHLTPSSANYLKNLAHFLERNTCWKGNKK